MGTTYAVASAKGGVGKTTTVANLGTVLASAGRSVAVVDADVGMANLATALGVSTDGASLHDLLAGEAELDDAVHEGPGGVALVPGSTSLDDYRDADPAGVAAVVADLAAEYEFVLLDTGAGLSHDTALPLGVADEVVLVSTPEPSALENTEKTRQLTDRLDGAVAGLVLVRASEGDDAGAVGADVLERVPDDPAVTEAVAAGGPVVSVASDSPAAAAYRLLAGTLFGVDVPDPAEAGEADESGLAVGDLSIDADAESAVFGGSAEDDAHAAGGGSEPAAESDEPELPSVERGGEPTDGPEGSPAAEDTGDGDDRTESGTDDAGEEPEAVDAGGTTDADGPPRKSVGPRRDEDVPVAEADEEGLVGEAPRTAAVEDDPVEEAEDTDQRKGFLGWLFGR